jgi:hypothetical protein
MFLFKSPKTMKKLFRILLFTCLATTAIAQQKPVYERTRTGQILSDRATWSKEFMLPPNSNIPAYVPDSLKDGALKNVTGASGRLQRWNVAHSAWEDISPDLSGYTLNSRSILNGLWITGGHSLATDVTISVDSANAVGKAYFNSVIGTSALARINTKLNLGGGTMLGALILNADPTTALGAATKNYVDNIATGLYWKQAARVATTANITLSGTQTIDGIAVIAGDRVLVRSQTAGSENGIYIVAAGAWARSADATTGTQILASALYIQSGATLTGGTQWANSNTGAITIGTTAITYGQLAGAGVYTNGTGISLTANMFGLDLTYTDARYSAKAGSSSIITVGNIGTGTWQATAITDSYIASATTWNAKQNALSGTGFVKIVGTTISYDNSTYLTTITPAGSNTYIQYNNSGALGASSDFTYNNSTKAFNVKINNSAFNIDGSSPAILMNYGGVPLAGLGMAGNYITGTNTGDVVLTSFSGKDLYLAGSNIYFRGTLILPSTGYFGASTGNRLQFNVGTGILQWAYFWGTAGSNNFYFQATGNALSNPTNGNDVMIGGNQNIHFSNGATTQDGLYAQFNTSGKSVILSSDGTFTNSASALLKIQSTTRGFLQSVMTTTQRNAISSPAEGLAVYNSTLKTHDYYDGTAWQSVATQTYTNTTYSLKAGSSNITTLGTIGTGVWNGSAIADTYISSASNWNTAYTDRNKWDGGATGLVAATGRTSLGLGTAALSNSADIVHTTGTENIGGQKIFTDALFVDKDLNGYSLTSFGGSTAAGKLLIGNNYSASLAEIDFMNSVGTAPFAVGGFKFINVDASGVTTELLHLKGDTKSAVIDNLVTAVPSGSSVATVKIGTVDTMSATLTTTQALTVEINGSIYHLALVH